MDDPAPSPLPADRRYECLRCAFSLTGLAVTDGRLTCPECGLTGSLAEVAEPEPPAFRWWLAYRVMCLPSLIISTAAFATLYLAFMTGWIMAGLISALLLFVSVIAALTIPTPGAQDLAAAHIRARRRQTFVVVVSLAGIAVNVVQAVGVFGAMTTLLSYIR